MKNICHKPNNISNMSRVLFSLAFFLFEFYSLNAQQYSKILEYTYDANGNRVKREIMYVELKSSKDTSKISSINSFIASSEISVFPNPTKGQLLVNITNLSPKETSSILIYDINGRQLITISPITESNNIDLSSYSSGVYVMKISIGTDTSEWKILKE